jgi:hypothetical protein
MGNMRTTFFWHKGQPALKIQKDREAPNVVVVYLKDIDEFAVTID